jgi:ferrous iron transport protein A
MKFTLNTISIESPAKIDYLNCTGPIKRRLLDLGFVKNSTITPVFESPSGGLTAYEIRNTVIALRDEDAKKVIVHN